MHTAALNGFCLLLCLLSPTTIYTMANKYVVPIYCLKVMKEFVIGETVAVMAWKSFSQCQGMLGVSGDSDADGPH